jgi:hypothetical protein
MAELDSGTIIAAIQSVQIAIRQQEKMLEAEVLGDRENTEEFIFVLESAKEKLRQAYVQEFARSDNLPPYESLLDVRQ